MPQHCPSNAPPDPPPSSLHLCSSLACPHPQWSQVSTLPTPPPLLSCTGLLNLSPPWPFQDLEAEQLLDALQGGSPERRLHALQHLASLASDMTFAQEVISRDGLQRLGSIIEDGVE